MKKIGFLLFENYWQRKDIGSSRIRGNWLIKYMPEAELYQQGKNYDAIIYQKVYWKENVRAFKGKKVLDICDPDWLDGVEIVEFIKNVDAITVPTERMKQDIEKMTDKPVYMIRDRVDFEGLPQPKKHEGDAKKVVWFGYSHNIDVIYPAFLKLRKMGLELIVISNDTINTKECKLTNVKWNIETVNQELQKADFALLPEHLRGRFAYKSDNKTVQCWALGLPVAKTPIDLERFMKAEERQKEADEKYKWVKENCDVRKSVEEMRKVLNDIKK